jgi:serine/threonine-protein kinase
MRETIGRYRITEKLGEGGMGVVYAALDEKLNRPVALKMIRDAVAGERARERLWREARSAARINHPNVCQLYEIDEEQGQLFIAMELLEGESLAHRLRRGPLPAADAVGVILPVLAALGELHRHGLVHRDLKPSNVFLTPHGAKLLDFGLARTFDPHAAETQSGLTLEGTIVGTPAYMAPEQVTEGAVDARSDLFAAGVILYEMLAGQPPFGGASTIEVLHALMYEQPAALSGSAGIAALDRVIRRALAKRPADRYGSSEDMAQDVRAALACCESGESVRARPMTRLIVLPFRMLRPDPETEFLAFSLPDAVASTLSGLESLVVRSSLAASQFSSEAPDLKRIATEAEVDVVLVGSLVRAGSMLRVSTQLVEAPGGTIAWSHTSQGSLADIFQLQDELASRIVESLALPLSAREHRSLKRDVPASAAAYEFYLRGNELSQRSPTWKIACEMYERCVEHDPLYAPAWARLGRIYRVLGKYLGQPGEAYWGKAEAAFARALQLNPDLGIAHYLSAYLDADLGRAEEAMFRLLERARGRTGDPELFAGLTHVCRYCGLLDASIAAYEHARRLDKLVPTSAGHTFFLTGEHERALTDVAMDTVGYLPGLLVEATAGPQEAVALLKRSEGMDLQPFVREFVRSARALFEGRRDECIEAMETVIAAEFRDPEGRYYFARQFAHLGEPDRAIAELEHAVDGGFFCFSGMARDGWLDPIRQDPRVTRILHRAQARERRARTAFLEAEGDRVLGLALQP